MKRKFENEFRQRNSNIFSEFKEAKNNFDLEQAVLNVIQKGNQISFEEVLQTLKILPTQIEERQMVNDILYNLIEKKQIRWDEKKFVELDVQLTTSLPTNSSPTLSKVVNIIERRAIKSIQLEELCDILVQEFQITDKKGEELNSHLEMYLADLKQVVVKEKRVFY